MMPMIPMRDDVLHEELQREAAAWLFALLCEPAVRAMPVAAKQRKRLSLRPQPPPPSPEAFRAFLVDGYRRLEVGEISKALANQQHPSAGVLAQVALGYELPVLGGHLFDRTADRSTLLRATERQGQSLPLAAHVAAFMILVGAADPRNATLTGALKAFRMLYPGRFNGTANGHPRRLWDRHEAAAPIALAYALWVFAARHLWRPTSVLLIADEVAKTLLELDERRPARRLFADRDVFWRPPPSIAAGQRVALRTPNDPALADAIRRGKADPVLVLADLGRGARCAHADVQVTTSSAPSMSLIADVHEEELT